MLSKRVGLCLGFILMAVSSVSQAKFLWYFDAPLSYQSMTLAITPENQASGLQRFVGQTVKLTPIQENAAPEIELAIKPQDLFRDYQIRILMPRLAMTQYTVDLSGLPHDEYLFPKKFKVDAKCYEVNLLCRSSKPKGAEGEKKGGHG